MKLNFSPSSSAFGNCANVSLSPDESNQILDLVSHFDGEKMNLTRFTSFTFTTTRFWSIYVVILIGVVSMFCIEVTEMFSDGIRYFKSGANAMDCTNILCSGRLLEGWRQLVRFTNFLAEMRFCCFGSPTTFIVANVRKMPNWMG